MPITIDGTTFYRTAEVCRIAGVSKNTLLRWIKGNKYNDVTYRDRRGWRLFTEDELTKLRIEVNRVQRFAD